MAENEVIEISSAEDESTQHGAPVKAADVGKVPCCRAPGGHVCCMLPAYHGGAHVMEPRAPRGARLAGAKRAAAAV